MGVNEIADLRKITVTEITLTDRIIFLCALVLPESSSSILYNSLKMIEEFEFCCNYTGGDLKI